MMSVELLEREASNESTASFTTKAVPQRRPREAGPAVRLWRRVLDPAPTAPPTLFGSELAASPDAFAHWLAMPRDLQREAVREFLRGRAAECGWPDLRGFARFSPYSPSDPRTRLFLCVLQAHLAVLRAGAGNRDGELNDAGQAVLTLMSRVEREDGNIGLSLKTVATELGVSQNHLGAEFHRIAGLSFRTFLRGVRVARAANLLAVSTLPVPRIALRLGYSEPSNLLREFRNTLGTSPSKFRRLMTDAISEEPQVAIPDSQTAR